MLVLESREETKHLKVATKQWEEQRINLMTELWRMSALLEISPEEVRVQVLPSMDECG